MHKTKQQRSKLSLIILFLGGCLGTWIHKETGYSSIGFALGFSFSLLWITKIKVAQLLGEFPHKNTSKKEE